ncbi:MAG TPA: carboxypeptidase regulatory-like domain-containing protein [Thermoanaerobaculia bacterium]|nr:carboxypeptidase regulatory-like domain-containing protein [Thermoanaerobaculia bacterium]
MRIRSALSLLFLSLFFLPSLFAQQGTSQLRGTITGPDGSALPGVTVTIKHDLSGTVRTTVTDKDGVYVMSGVIPGPYGLTAELSGFKTFRHRGIRLEVGRTTTVNAKLTLGEVSEEMTVTAAAPVIDVTSKEVGGNITSKELTELPSVNRNFIGFIGLLPGVVPNISTESFGADSVSVNGEDPRNNNYMFDGGNNNDDVIGQRAGTQARPPLDAIQEFQVLTGQFDAEFGRTTGAVVNAVTKQGTNDFQGMLSGYLQDASFTQKDFFVRQTNGEKPDTHFQQYAGNLGGPIIQDKLHFFFNVERVADDRPNPVFIPARPDINFPVTQDRVWNTLVRVDNQINASNTWAARWLRESSPQLNQIIPIGSRNVTPAASREESDIDQTAVAEYNSVIGAARLNTARFTWTQENVAFANPGFNKNGRNQAALPPTLLYLTFADQQNDVAQARIDNAWQLNDTFNWYADRHDMKFGLEYEHVTENFSNQGDMNGVFTFRSDAPFNPSDPSTYPERFQIRVPGQAGLHLPATFLSGFAQDKWNFSPNATLSYGIRYDLERIPMTEADNPLFANGQQYPYDKNNWSPRIGITYQLPAAKTTVLRGGIGRFYDKTHLELIQGAATAGIYSDSFLATFPANGPDPGPANGQMPTDPTLVNGPVVNFDYLRSLFPPGSRIKNTGTVTLDNPNRTVPYSDMISVGAQRELMPSMSVSLDYVYSRGRDLLMSYELNPATRADTRRTTPIHRTNPQFINSTLERVNTGSTTYHAIEFQLDHHLGQSYQYRISYTYSRSRGNTGGGFVPTSPFQYLQDMNLNLNEGPTDFDKPHNFVLSGSMIVPHTHGLTLATVVRYLSGDPLTIQDTNIDADQNGVLFDPLPSGTYSGHGQNAITVNNRGGRNGARGPDFFQMDLRAGYLVPVQRMHLEIFGEIFNVTNRANFANPSGDRRSSNFLVLTSLRSGAVPRTGQLGAKILF